MRAVTSATPDELRAGWFYTLGVPGLLRSAQLVLEGDVGHQFAMDSRPRAAR